MLRTPPAKKPTRRPTMKPAAKRKRRKRRNPPTQLAPAHKRERLKPISLWPLDFDTAMRGLLAVSIATKKRRATSR
jgi:hypothetical protein